MSNDPRFFAFLKERIGLDVASVGEAIIERAVRQRSQAVAPTRRMSTGSTCSTPTTNSKR